MVLKIHSWDSAWPMSQTIVSDILAQAEMLALRMPSFSQPSSPETKASAGEQ